MLGAILWKDMRRELRSKEGLMAGAITVFMFLIVDLLSFDTATNSALVAFLIWIPLLFGCVVAVGRGMSQEVDKGTLEWLLSLPILPWHIAASRTLVDTALIALLGTIGTLGVAALYGTTVSAELFIVLALAVVGLGVVGALVGALAANGKQRESLLPMLLIPLLIPLLHAGLAATRTVLAGDGIAASAVMIMVGYDALMLGAGVILWPYLLEEA